MKGSLCFFQNLTKQHFMCIMSQLKQRIKRIIMKISKKLISLLLAFLMLVSIIPAVDFSADAAAVVYAADIVDYARQYIGYPYKLGTKGPNSFDCAGFVNYVFKHFGIDLPTNASSYFYNPTKYGTLIDTRSVEKAKTGDVIAWEGHVAIYTEDGYCVEALGTKYGVCEQLRVDRHRSNGMNYKVIRINGVYSENYPIITSISSTNTGVQIDWYKYRDSKNYNVYRRTSSTGWIKIADAVTTSYVDTSVKSGMKYWYTVRSKSADGKKLTSGYDSVGTSITFLSPPKLTEVSNVATGVKISWEKISGAAKYRVFYRTDTVGWTKIGDTTSTNLTWTGAKSGTDYKFTVRCISSDAKSYTSGYDPAGLGIFYVAAPELTSIAGVNNGISISWNAVKGAVNYKVFRKTANGAWSTLGTTTALSFTDTTSEIGTKYTYTVRCVSEDGLNYVSGYDGTGKSITTVSTPVLSSVANAPTGVNISWGKVAGAAKYRVFYKANGENTWHSAGDTTSVSYTWTGAKSGTDYTFTVRCITSDGKVFTSGFDAVGKSLYYIAAPKLSSVTNTQAGVNISWGKVTGAECYRLFYKIGSGTWKEIVDTASTSYTWTGAKSGTNYTFTVRCISAETKEYMSSYNAAGMSLTYLSAPVLASAYADNSGVYISWGKVTGAARYRVFYKANGESTWHTAGDTASTTFVWTGAKNNTNYTFTVRCISSDGKTFTSGFDAKGINLKPVASPVLSSIAAVNGGNMISWNAVNGAARYKVFRKIQGGSWSVLDTTTSTSFTDTTAVNGTKYIYTVRCVTADGKTYTSGYDLNGKGITAVTAPVLSSVFADNSGIHISWGKVAGAAKYRVFYKANGESTWHTASDTASTSFVWTSAKNSTNYTFTVRCITSDGKVYTSGFDIEGLNLKYVASPALSSVAAINGGIMISWNAVSGAENYKVFRKISGGSWAVLDTTASTSFTDTTVVNGTKYIYTVRCVTADGATYTSGYDVNGKSITAVTAPVLSSVSVDNSGIVIKWNKVSNAEKYRVFYKANGENAWHTAGDTASTSFVWTSAKSNTDYTFTVRCVSADGKTFTSGFDADGLNAKYLSTPKLSSAANAETGVELKWNEIEGADLYRLFYKIGSGSWKEIADVDSTDYIWSDAVSGTNYTFTVRCVSTDGAAYTSGYDAAGINLTYISTPVLSSVTASDSGIEIKWEKVTGAENYRVFYKESVDNAWHKAGDTTSDSFVWAEAEKGLEYTFTVRCISADAKVFTSGYDPIGISIIYE